MSSNRSSFVVMLILLILATLLLSGCQGAASAAADVAADGVQQDSDSATQPSYAWGEAADRLWVLVGYGDAANPTVVAEGAVMTAVFSSVEPIVSGSGGCNNFFTSYESTDDGSLTIAGPIGSTMMFCEGFMDAETAYFAALEAVTGWLVTEDGQLELAYDTGQAYEGKLVFAEGQTPLTGTTWNLVSFGDPEEEMETVIPGTSITAVFEPESDDSGTVGGSSTCNSYSTSYDIAGNQIAIGPIAGTMMLCPVGADQEQAYLTALESAETFQIAGPNLQIVYDGGMLNFTSLNLPLQNVLWQALAVNGQPVPLGVELTAFFSTGDEAGQGAVGGTTGCNNFNSMYETSSDISTNPTTHFLTINSPMALTMAACPDEDLANLEAAYLAALEGAETYEILFDQLIINAAEGQIAFTADREPLMGTKWELVSLGDINDPQPPVEDSSFTASFNRLPTLPSGTVTGDTGCNEWNATFTSNLTNIKVNLPFKSNNEDCPAGLMEQEQQFFLGLNSATEFHILGNRLYIPYGEADSLQVLNFQAAPPDVEEEEEGLDLTPLADTFWYLRSIGDNALISHTEITAAFEIDEGGLTGTISGSSGCNGYNGSVDGSNGSFDVGPLGTTSKACEPDVMDQEGGYLDWLSKAYSYDRAGDQLLISTGNGVLTYQSTPVLDQTQELQDKTWYMVTVGTLDAVPGSKATTMFSSSGQAVSGYTGCNNFQGSYRTEPGNKLAISGFTSNLAACPSEALAKQEDALLVFLPSAISYTVVGTQMQIQTVDGSVINYTAEAPAEPTGPTAVINAPEYADLGQLIYFDGSGSKAGDTSIVRYEWDMGDGTIISDPSHSYAYNEAGSFQVTLTVSDQAGLTDTAEQTVLVRPVVEVIPPTAVINGPTHAFTNESVTFDGSGSLAGDSPIATYTWNMGDGTTLNGTTIQHAYSAPNDYEVRLTVTDEDGKSNAASQMILVQPTVEAVPPTAVIEGPATAFVGDRVSFSATNSTAGSADIAGYQWQSGDGNNSGPGAGSGFTTVYVQPGIYYPAVTVTDADGLSDSASTTITINASLQGADWILNNSMPGSAISLVFANGGLSGFSGCNNYNATYTTTLAEGPTNSISVGPISSSQQFCTPELMDQEQGYLGSLQTASQYTISGSTLTLTTADGPLTFSAAVATPAPAPAPVITPVVTQ